MNYFTKVLIPKNNGLKEKAIEALKQVNCKEIEILEFRGEDIPKLVEEFNRKGINAVGITGEDLFEEYRIENENNLSIIQNILWENTDFVFKKPSLCLLCKKEKELPDFKEKVVVAINKKFERLSENFLEKLRRNGLEIETKIFNGNTELAVKQGLADLCVEIVCTGKSLEESGLKIIDKFFESNLVLIGAKERSEKKPQLQRLFETVKERIDKKETGSYTAKIVEKGIVLKKLNEECFELTTAFFEGRKSKIVWETADLLYFLAVALAEKEIQLEAVWAELKRRELENKNIKGLLEVEK